MLKKILTCLTIIVIVAFFTGCASIAKGTSQLMTVNCNVDGAALTLDGAQIGTTPFTGKVPKGKSILMISKPGYASQSIALSKGLEPMFWGNIIIGGTLGSITDWGTGAAYSYTPASYQIDLRKDGQSLNDFERQYKVRKFSMLYYSQISFEVASGKGEHLDALVSLLGARSNKEEIVLLIKKAVKESQGDQVIFGNRISLIIQS